MHKTAGRHSSPSADRGGGGSNVSGARTGPAGFLGEEAGESGEQSLPLRLEGRVRSKLPTRSDHREWVLHHLQYHLLHAPHNHDVPMCAPRYHTVSWARSEGSRTWASCQRSHGWEFVQPDSNRFVPALTAHSSPAGANSCQIVYTLDAIPVKIPFLNISNTSSKVTKN